MIKNHGLKGKSNLFGWGHTPLIRSPATPHLISGLVWQWWAPNLWSMVPYTTQTFGFLLVPNLGNIAESHTNISDT